MWQDSLLLFNSQSNLSPCDLLWIIKSVVIIVYHILQSTTLFTYFEKHYFLSVAITTVSRL